MSSPVTVTPIDRCANSACPNRAHEGVFAVVETDAPVVGGHRPLRFVLCVPCATALADLASAGTGTPGTPFAERSAALLDGTLAVRP